MCPSFCQLCVPVAWNHASEGVVSFLLCSQVASHRAREQCPSFRVVSFPFVRPTIKGGMRNRRDADHMHEVIALAFCFFASWLWPDWEPRSQVLHWGQTDGRSICCTKNCRHFILFSCSRRLEGYACAH